LRDVPESTEADLHKMSANDPKRTWADERLMEAPRGGELDMGN